MKYSIIENIFRCFTVPVVVALCTPLLAYATIAYCTEIAKDRYNKKRHEDKDVKISENPIFIRETYHTRNGLEERVILTE